MATASQDRLLRALREDLIAVRGAALELVDALDEQQITWQPDGRTWSIARCFEHLRRFDRAYCRPIAGALDRTFSRHSPHRTYRPSLTGRLVLLGLAPGRRMLPLPAPRFTRPDVIVEGEGRAAVRRFLDQQDEVLNLTERAASIDVNAVRFAFPLTSLLSLKVGDGITIIVRHQQRHLEQARALVRHPRFPRGPV